MLSLRRKCFSASSPPPAPKLRQQQHCHDMIMAARTWRRELGSVFGPLYVHQKLTPSTAVSYSFSSRCKSQEAPASSSSSRPTILLIADLDQSSVFCGADSGEIPGLYGTAMLRDDQSSSLTMKPADWVALCGQDAAFRDCLFELIDKLDHHRHLVVGGGSDDCDAGAVRCTNLPSNNNTKEVQQKKQSDQQGDVDEAQRKQVAYDLRCFALACCVCSCVSTSKLLYPSWTWMTRLVAEQEACHQREQLRTTKNNIDDDLEKAYSNALKMTTSHVWLPSLQKLRAAWSIVRNRSLHLQYYYSNNSDDDALSSKTNSIAVPCLVPVISSHIMKTQQQPPTTDDVTAQKKKSASSSWTGFKKPKNVSPSLLSSRVVVSASLLTSAQLATEFNHQQRLVLPYVGRRFLRWPELTTQTNGGERLFVVLRSEDA